MQPRYVEQTVKSKLVFSYCNSWIMEYSKSLQKKETESNSACVLTADVSSRLSLLVVMLLEVFLSHTLIKILLPGYDLRFET